MAITLNPFEWRGLETYINNSRPIMPFILENVFKNSVMHQNETIDYETLDYSNNLANFVADSKNQPDSIGINVTKNGKTFTIPRTWEEKEFSQQQLRDMQPVGSIYGSLEAINQYRAEIIAGELDDLQRRVINRREQMACSALYQGTVSATCAGRTYDYNYNFVSGSQTMTASPLWSSTGKPIADIQKFKRLIHKACGYVPDLLILGTDAADAFLKNSDVQTYLDTNNFRLGSVDLTATDDNVNVISQNFMGMKVVEYDTTYNASGTDTSMIAANRAIAVATKCPRAFTLHKAMCYNVNDKGILTPASAGEFAMTATQDKYGKSLTWTCEQRSLPVIHVPSAVISATVTA